MYIFFVILMLNVMDTGLIKFNVVLTKDRRRERKWETERCVSFLLSYFPPLPAVASFFLPLSLPPTLRVFEDDPIFTVNRCCERYKRVHGRLTETCVCVPGSCTRVCVRPAVRVDAVYVRSDGRLFSDLSSRGALWYVQCTQ